MPWPQGKQIVEALLLAAPDPLTLRRIAEIMEVDERSARALLDDLRIEYEGTSRGIVLQEVAGGYQLVTNPACAAWVEKLVAPRTQSLSHAALETLAIVAYRQPATRGEIEQVRGVSADGPLRTLLDRRMIREVGRREVPGRPILYGTTKEFLLYFGLKDLSELPALPDPSAAPSSDHLGRETGGGRPA